MSNICEKCEAKKTDLYLYNKARTDGSIKELWYCRTCYEGLAKKKLDRIDEIEARILCDMADSKQLDG